MKTITIINAALAACLSATVLAQPAPPPARSAERQAHSPAPATVTRAQVQARVQQRIAAMDADRDGTVTKAEFGAYRAKARADRWAEHETMRAQRRDAMFAMLDTNKDGQISKAEFTTARETRAMGHRDAEAMQEGDHRFADGPGERGRDMKDGGMRDGFGGGHGDAAFAMLDANKDGRITLAEASARSLARFDRLDANKDGKVTSEERRAARAGLRGPGSIMRG